MSFRLDMAGTNIGSLFSAVIRGIRSQETGPSQPLSSKYLPFSESRNGETRVGSGTSVPPCEFETLQNLLSLQLWLGSVQV